MTSVDELIIIVYFGETKAETGLLKISLAELEGGEREF